MCFENRFLSDFSTAQNKIVTVAFVQNTPIGFSFATVEKLSEGYLANKPLWARALKGIGVFLEDSEVPRTIEIFKLLYIQEQYRHQHIGDELTKSSMSMVLHIIILYSVDLYKHMLLHNNGDGYL